MITHPFWTILTFAVIIWYIVVTAIVAYKGSTDIKNMLKKLEDEKNERS
jgi:hypothetical protein